MIVFSGKIRALDKVFPLPNGLRHFWFTIPCVLRRDPGGHSTDRKCPFPFIFPRLETKRVLVSSGGKEKGSLSSLSAIMLDRLL